MALASRRSTILALREPCDKLRSGHVYLTEQAYRNTLTVTFWRGCSSVGEHLPGRQGVKGSNPFSSTTLDAARRGSVRRTFLRRKRVTLSIPALNGSIRQNLAASRDGGRRRPAPAG